MNKFAISTATVLGIAAMSSSAMAAPRDGANFTISMNVPIVCDIDTTTFFVDKEQSVVRGYVNEYCNSSRGFQVLASHRPLEAGEQVEVSYDGIASNLSQTGLSAIAFRSGARVGAVPVAIRTDSMQDNLSVGLSVTAI